jgi:hypothetical protein
VIDLFFFFFFLPQICFHLDPLVLGSQDVGGGEASSANPGPENTAGKRKKKINNVYNNFNIFIL